MKITIYAICKNEEKFVDRWFNSIKDADYIRVLDTGSTDNTIALLQKLKANHPNKFDYSCQEIKPWRFDTARNAAMQLVPSDSEVLVSADLDDVFIPNWRNIVERNIEKGYNKIFGHYPYYNDAGEIVSQTLQDRVCLNNGSYWEGAIHERLITPNENSTIDDEWIIEHRQDESKDRRENYLTAAKNGAQDGGFYARLCLGYELYNSGYIEESLNTFKELYNDLSQDSEFLTRKMLVFMGQLCKELGHPTSAALYYRHAKTIYKQNSPFEDYFLYEENYINNLIKEIYSTKVCVYTICKDEEKFVMEWFDRVKDADLIVVLDTGSSDNTYKLFEKLAEENSNLIIKQKRYDYFSFCDARNDALQIVKNTLVDLNGWVALHIDMDEMIDYHTPDYLRSQWNDDYDLVELTAYNVNNMIVVKGHKLCNNIQWYYDLHEKTAYNDFRQTNNLLIQDCGYNHYQDTTKNRNYYGKLQCALEKHPNCVHYLTYAIWEAEIHNDYDNLKQYCERNMQVILTNEEDEYYKDWSYYIYTCLVYINNYDVSEAFIKEVLYILDQQDEFFRGYYLFKAQLCKQLGLTEERRKNLYNALNTPRTNRWIEANFTETDEEINKELNKNMNKICVYAITKNESQFVERWYNSMKEADEIVVLDTGSTDDTVEKLRALGVKVEQKIYNPWRFDIPRNDAMELAPADCNILLSTDLDEILEPGWAKPLREGWIEGVHTRAQYKYVWSHTDTGAEGRVFGYNKIHSREWLWRYPVHELLWNPTTNSELYSAAEELNLFDMMTLHHYPDKTKSRSSYLPLLELREQENPEDLYGLIYLAHEYFYQGLYEKSIDKLLKALTYPNIEIIERASCYLFMGDSYVELNQLEQAIDSYEKGIEVEDSFRELYLNKAKVLMSLERNREAIKTILLGLEKSYRHYSWLERDISWSYEPYDLLCLAYYYTGDKHKALFNAKKALSYDNKNSRLQENVQIIEKQIEYDQTKPCTYVSVLSNNSFINGIVMLKQSLDNVKSQYPLHCIVTPEVSQENRLVLEQIGVHIIDKNPSYFIDNIDKQIQIIETLDTYGWHKAMIKLELFNLTDFYKIVYLDADMLVLDNIDHLFNKPHMSAAKDLCDNKSCKGNGSFNSGLLVIEPNEYEYQQILQHLKLFNEKEILIHDQLILQDYFKDWMDQSLTLSPNYNFWTTYFNEESEEYFFNHIKVLHFIDKKPWLVNKDYFYNYQENYYQYAQINLWYIDYLNYTIRKLQKQNIYSSDLKFIN